MRTLITVLISALMCSGFAACGSRGDSERHTDSARDSGPGFRSPDLLEEHYRKHGFEFGTVSKSEYLQLARRLRDTPPGGPILQNAGEDGIITKFDRRNGYFGAYNGDGTIRTFFVPNDGERYFHRQARRHDR